MIGERIATDSKADALQRHYLDYAATAPLCEEAIAAMERFFTAGPASISLNANANSLHLEGRNAFKLLEQARKSVADSLCAKRPDEILFTSGATEADNAALIGIAHAAAFKRHLNIAKGAKPRVITSAIEHDAVLKPAAQLAKEGFDVFTLPVTSEGFVTVEALQAALNDETVLVSIQMANSEVGSIQPVAALCRLAHEAGALFHTDATQAIGKIPFSVVDLDMDAASLSAHKLGGPRGIGALYLKAKTPFEPLLTGGGQEKGLRSGTQAHPLAIGFAAALEVAVEQTTSIAQRCMAFRDELYGTLEEKPEVRASVHVPAGSVDYLPNIVHFLRPGVDSESMIIRADGLGIALSGGSACSSRSLEPSHVLSAMGIARDDAFGALRLSFGRYTTQADIDAFIACADEILADSV